MNCRNYEIALVLVSQPDTGLRMSSSATHSNNRTYDVNVIPNKAVFEPVTDPHQTAGDTCLEAELKRGCRRWCQRGRSGRNGEVSK